MKSILSRGDRWFVELRSHFMQATTAHMTFSQCMETVLTFVVLDGTGETARFLECNRACYQLSASAPLVKPSRRSMYYTAMPSVKPYLWL